MDMLFAFQEGGQAIHLTSAQVTEIVEGRAKLADFTMAGDKPPTPEMKLKKPLPPGYRWVSAKNVF